MIAAPFHPLVLSSPVPRLLDVSGYRWGLFGGSEQHRNLNVLRLDRPYDTHRVLLSLTRNSTSEKHLPSLSRTEGGVIRDVNEPDRLPQDVFHSPPIRLLDGFGWCPWRGSGVATPGRAVAVARRPLQGLQEAAGALCRPRVVHQSLPPTPALRRAARRSQAKLPRSGAHRFADRTPASHVLFARRA